MLCFSVALKVCKNTGGEQGVVVDEFGRSQTVFCGFFEQVELQRAVQECSETVGGVEQREDDETGQSRGVHQRLLKILTRLLQEGGASGEGGGAWEGKGHIHTALNF